MSSEQGRAVRTVAPAKINLTLEVLGKRGDGYHEIRSVMQTIDLCDEVSVEKSSSSRFETPGGNPLGDDDLMVRAARALEEQMGRELPARVRVQKRIPAASGLGGGSSDAAALLRGMDCLHGLGLSREEMAAIGAEVGSDVPFFIYGGTALVEGRGERVTPLGDVPEIWLAVMVPDVAMPAKTKRMYASLIEADFTDGLRTEDFVAALRGSRGPLNWRLYNAFERAACEVFGGLDGHRDALLKAGARTAHLAGSGPGLFAFVASREEGQEIASRLEGSEARSFVARTLTAGEATRLNGLAVSG